MYWTVICGMRFDSLCIVTLQASPCSLYKIIRLYGHCYKNNERNSLALLNGGILNYNREKNMKMHTKCNSSYSSKCLFKVQSEAYCRYLLHFYKVSVAFLLQASPPNSYMWCTTLKFPWAAWLCLREDPAWQQTQTLTSLWWSWKVISRTPRDTKWSAVARDIATVTSWSKSAQSQWAPAPGGYLWRCGHSLILEVREELHLLSLSVQLWVCFSQVEYCPCVVPGDCWNLMREFIQSFLGNNVPELPTVFAAKPEGLFAPADCVDTMTQYLELFNKLRKLQIPASNVRWVCSIVCFFLLLCSYVCSGPMDQSDSLRVVASLLFI